MKKSCLILKACEQADPRHKTALHLGKNSTKPELNQESHKSRSLKKSESLNLVTLLGSEADHLQAPNK